MSILKPDTQQDSDPTFLGDQPAREAKDPLGFDQIADRLAAVVQASRGSTPFTLGIEGGWGGGKSTLMHHLREKLDPSALRPP
ncbi:MAG: P-loop NTPase fold protein, partial [Actinomycetota bacterium]|nr:P-loop NTPase fold protein [Actinomycetota bacterium]